MNKLFNINMNIGNDFTLRGGFNKENNVVIITGLKVGSSFLDSVTEFNNDILPYEIKYESNEQIFKNQLHIDSRTLTKLTDKQQRIFLKNLNEDKLTYIFITRDPYQKMITSIFQILKEPEFENLFDLSDYYENRAIGTCKETLREIRDEIGISNIDMNYDNTLREIIKLSATMKGDYILQEPHMDLHNQKIMTYIRWLTDVKQSDDIDIFVSDISHFDEIVLKYKFINKEKIEFANKHQTKLLDGNYNFIKMLRDISNHGEARNIALGMFKEYITDTLHSEYLFYDMLLEKYKLPMKLV